ncbi:MAG: histidine phosphatase family protein, partial [bacterium]
RHGENHANLIKQLSSKLVDYPLTEKGILQAQQTGEALAGRGIKALFCSPLKRAKQTAEIVGTYI